MNSVQELVFHICIHVYVFITGISLFFEKQQIFMKIQLGVKTNGNFGGFPVGNDILSNMGISLGNPHDVCYLKNHLHTYSTQVVNYLYPGRGVAEKVSSVGFCLGSGLFGSCNSD